jgi:hypothetical protein
VGFFAFLVPAIVALVECVGTQRHSTQAEQLFMEAFASINTETMKIKSTVTRELFVRGDMDEASYSLACMRKCLLPKACRAERDSCVTLRVTWSGHFFDISVDVVAVGVFADVRIRAVGRAFASPPHQMMFRV